MKAIEINIVWIEFNPEQKMAAEIDNTLIDKEKVWRIASC